MCDISDIRMVSRVKNSIVFLNYFHFINVWFRVLFYLLLVRQGDCEERG